MTIEIKLVTKKPARSQLHVLIVPSDQIDELAESIDRDFLKSRDFKGESGQILFTHSEEQPVALLGVGPLENLAHVNYRQAGAKLLREVKNFHSMSVDFCGYFNENVDQPNATQAFHEDAYLGAYAVSYTHLKLPTTPYV